MVYEVCALVLTIILGMVGVQLVLVLHSTRQLMNEARNSLRTLNRHMSGILDSVEKSAQGIQAAAEVIEAGASQVAAGLQGIKSPLVLFTYLIGLIREGLAIWKGSKTDHQQE